MNLKQKTIIVTGSSRGIGAGIAQKLSHLGANVIVTYSSNPEQAKSLMENLSSEGKHILLPLDVSDESSVENLVNETLKNYGQIDGLVNNAGITKDQLLLRMGLEDFSLPLDINLKGTFLMSKYCIKSMLKRKAGSIVNITSVVGHTGNPGQVNYSASKAAITGLSKSMAQEIGSRNIRINCIAPGFITTDMTNELNEKQKQTILNNIPLKTLGDTEDVANAAAFLLSDQSKYITGHTLHVNGGMYMN